MKGCSSIEFYHGEENKTFVRKVKTYLFFLLSIPVVHVHKPAPQLDLLEVVSLIGPDLES